MLDVLAVQNDPGRLGTGCVGGPQCPPVWARSYCPKNAAKSAMS